MQTKTYSKAVNATTLAAQLEAALPALYVTRTDGLGREVRYQLFPDVASCRVTVPDDIDLAAVDGVLAAHDASVLAPAQQQAQQDTLDLADLRAQAAAILTRMTAVEQAASPTNAQVIQAVKDEATAIKRLVKALGILVRYATP